ncbi:ImmA/IrrE family metallo-endopeptidase [Patescibacteria group bacterium]|nr:ImmA/IrrE family metallo-endopeptidase [Patescibacteria group bacterium]
MKKPDYKKAEKTASNLLKNHGIEAPFVNVITIAEREGLKLQWFNPDSLTNQYPRVPAFKELREVAGFFDPETNTIHINENDPPNRQTFTIAHELGHYVLGHSDYGVLPRWQKLGEKKEPVEKEADAFAASLLVPIPMLKSTMSEYSLSKKDVGILARLFAVSEEMMRYRLPLI